MEGCDIPFTFPVKATILESDRPPFKKGAKIVIRQLPNGKIKFKLRGSKAEFKAGDIRQPVGDLPGKIVILFTFEGLDQHMVIMRVRCGDKIRDCGTIVKLSDTDRGVGTWISEEDA